MKTQYEDIDSLIKKALNEEEAEFYQSLDEQSLPEMFAGLFKGKNRWITIMTMFIMPVLFGLAIYCAFQFFQADDMRKMLIWGAGGFLFLMATTMLKLFHWMQMDKNALMRELKRLELQIAVLSGKSGSSG